MQKRFIVALAILIILTLLVPSVLATPGLKFRSDLNNSGVYDDGGIRPTNNVKWTFTTGHYVYSSPTVVNGVVYIVSEDNNVYAIYATNGTELWSFFTGGWVDSSPAVVNDIVYVGSLDKNLYALEAATGTLIWNFNTDGEVRSSPAVVNGVVYVGSKGNNLSLIHI